MIRPRVRPPLLLLAPAALLLAACGNDEDPGPTGPDVQLTNAYIGSDQCSFCHTDIYNAFRRSGHPYKLNKVTNAQPPSYPFTTVANPPNGVSWSDVTYVIGGFHWKARFIGKDGYIITAGGQNQLNLATGAWSDYHKDEQKPYNCGPCHTTGYRSDGHQDSLPGIIGRWAFPGIQCEECHGPGDLHSRVPDANPMSVDTRSQACGRCHNRGGLNATILASGGFTRHHEQYNELQSTTMRALECVTCHNPHSGVLHNDEEQADAFRLDCEDCHTTARASLERGPLAAVKATASCTTCHMPKSVKNALAFGPYEADEHTHVFRINADSAAPQFTADRGRTNPYIALDYACLTCHPTQTKGWAAVQAPGIHGPNFRFQPVTIPEGAVLNRFR